jgi:hypothetical protein
MRPIGPGAALFNGVYSGSSPAIAGGQVVGKAKRVRAALSTTLEQAPDRGEVFVAALTEVLRGNEDSARDCPIAQATTRWPAGPHHEGRRAKSRENFHRVMK